MKKYFGLGVAVAFLSVASMAQAAGYQEAVRDGGSDKAVVIQNSQLSSSAKTKDITTTDNAVVEAATVDVTNGATIQNSEVNAASDTGNIKASGNSAVNAGGIKVH